MVATAENLYKMNYSDTNVKKTIAIIGKSYKFIELDKLKNYNIIYLNAFKELEKYQSIDYILLNEESVDANSLQNVSYVKLSTFIETNLKKLYLNKEYNLKTYSKFQYLQKRVVDFAISIPLMTLALPIMLYSAYKIKKESPDGPIFFKQKRVGKDGKEFECYKFRSMRTNIDYFNHYTQENDPRIFKWGEFMRRTRIDELPQIINVLKGDMHFIGPRAEWNELVKRYEKEIYNYHNRHLVAPGITGWAQVNYPYGANIEDTKQKLMYDLYYIKNWSLWLEIKTILKTIKVVLKREGK